MSEPTANAEHQLYDWHIGWTLFRLGFTSIISLDNYGWWIECMCWSLLCDLMTDILLFQSRLRSVRPHSVLFTGFAELEH